MAELAQLAVSLELQTAAFQKGFADATASMNRFEAQGRKLNQSVSQMSSALGGIAKAAAGAVAAFASFSTLNNIVTGAEKVATLKASFEALLGSGERAADMMTRVVSVAQKTGSPLDGVAEATQRLSVALAEVGASNAQISTIAETFIKLGKVSGSSMADVNGALVQFAQGLSSGKLQGDELRSIMERVPLVVQLIAKEMGVSTGEVKKLGAEGKITAEIMANSLLKAASNVNEQFAKLPLTSEQAFNKMQTAATQLAVELDKAFNFSGAKITGLDAIASGLQNLGRFVLDVKAAWDSLGFEDKLLAAATAVSALAVTFSGPLVAGITAVTAVLAANPFGAFAVAAAAAAVLVIANWDKVKAFFEFGLPQGLATLNAAWNSAMSNILSVTQNVVSSIVKFFGSGVNTIIEQVNSLGGIGEKFGVGFKLDKVAEEFTGLSTKIDEFNAKAISSGEVAKAYGDLWEGAQNRIKQSGIEAANETEAGAIKIKGATEGIAAAGKSGADSLDALRQKALAIRESIDPALALKNAISELDTMLKAGLLSWEEYGQAVEKAKEKINGGDSIKSSIDDIKDAVTGFAKEFTDKLVDSIFEGKMNFEKFATDIAKTIIKTLLNKQVQTFINLITKGFEGGGGSGGLGGLFGGIFGGGSSGFGPGTSGFWAKGGAFNNGVEFFANGGIVGARTAFGMAGGRIGIMGEAGPEAIVPLRRSASGDLGVRSSPVVVNVINQAGVQVETTEKEDPNGQKTILMMIRREVGQAINDGSYDKQFRGAYGLTRQGY
jgi:tape measure domain-containing protein